MVVPRAERRIAWPSTLFTLEKSTMKKLLAVLAAGLFTAGAFAQAPAVASGPLALTAYAPAAAAPKAAQARHPIAKAKAKHKATHVAKKKSHKKLAKKKTAYKSA